MRVVHLAAYGGPYPGSFIPMLRAALAAARAHGWSAEVVFSAVARGRDWLGELEADGVSVRFAPDLSRRRRRSWVAALLAESTAPTVLHTHFTAFDVPAAAAARGRPATAVFWHVHSSPRPELQMRIRNVLKYSVYGRSVDGVLCVAPHIADAVRGRRAPQDRVVAFANAIDTGRFPPVTPEARREAREQLGLPADARVLVHFAWNWYLKGGDLFLETVKLLKETGQERLVGVTVGGGAEARSLRRELGLSSEVRVLEPVDNVQALYAAADLFVAPSRAEGTPFAVAEALCSGVPVVASDIPGHALLGETLRACRLAALDPAGLAGGVSSMLGSDLAADTAAARLWIRDNMDLKEWSARLMGLYERALDSTGR